jgi:hypothetical protein
MAAETRLDRKARRDLRVAKRMHGNSIPDHVRAAAEAGSDERAERRAERAEKRTAITGYLTESSRLGRIAPASVMVAATVVGDAAHGHPTAGFTVTALSGGVVWFARRASVDTAGKKLYAAAVIGWTGEWSMEIASHGLGWHGTGAAAFLAGAAVLAGPWVYSHLWRWTPTPELIDEPPSPHSWFREAWEQYRPAPADMEDEVEVPNGRQATLVVERGKKSVEDITAVARFIRSTYDPKTTIIEPVGARRARLTVLERDDVLADGPRWVGATLDPATGLFAAGRWPDGQMTHGQLWAPRSGATDLLVIGTKGSGKSEFLNKVACELHLSPFCVAWFSDPQEGQCLPDWIETADRYAIGGDDNIDQNMRMLRALRRITYRRSRHLGREIEWTDAHGHERKGGKRYFNPTEADAHGNRIPLLHALLDEQHALVRHPEHGKEAVAILGDIQRLSRKAGIGVSWAGHSAGLSEMGGHEASIIRSLIKEGMRVAFRTGETVTAYQLGLSEDPSHLPEFFADGSKTHGLGLIGGGPDRRTTQFRAEWVEDVYAIARKPPVGRLDDMSAEAAAMPDDPERAPKHFTVPGFGGTVPFIPTAADKATWADRVLPVFADGAEHAMGAVIKAFPADVADRSIRWGLKKLVADGYLHTAGDKRPYVITPAGCERLAQLGHAEAVA